MKRIERLKRCDLRQAAIMEVPGDSHPALLSNKVFRPRLQQDMSMQADVILNMFCITIA